MASNQGTVSTSAPIFAPSLIDAPVPPSSLPSPDPDVLRARSLKRGRPDQLGQLATLGQIGPATKSPRFKGTFTPIPLTGAAAIADQQRKQAESQAAQQPAPTSPNPASRALSSLMAGGGATMSAPKDAPTATTAMSDAMSTIASAITIPPHQKPDERVDTSPASATSLASLASTAPTATASPTSIPNTGDADGRDPRPNAANHVHLSDLPSPNRALSFPGNLLGHNEFALTPSRGMSLPMPGPNQQLAPRSPSQKKHKCQYCNTEFTRHHNLKSHLLTHSQEKPFVCQTCTMRFRRLHDLKRHMKLHTGERPHICPKCDRKFARGDALARHAKGQGGCAGRRASMGSFGDNDDFDESNVGDMDDSGMDGVMYTNGVPHGHDPDNMSEDDRRGFSLPSIKAQHVPGQGGPGTDTYPAPTHGHSTYPPAGPRMAPSGSLYPPRPDHPGSSGSTATTPSAQSSGGGRGGGHVPSANMTSLPAGSVSSANSSVFPQSNITESPKPLSPAGMHSHQLGHDGGVAAGAIGRQRSPSMTTQFQQAHFGRRQSGRSPPPDMSLPSPLGSNTSAHGGPKLPALSGLAPPESRYTLPSQTPGQGQVQSPNQRGPPQPQVSSNTNNSNNLFAAGDQGVWAYVQTLEERVKQLSDKVLVLEAREMTQEEKIGRLSEELFMLKAVIQGGQQQQQSSVTAHQGHQ